jgi:hypothetical protein
MSDRVKEHHLDVGRNAMGSGDLLTAQNAYLQVLREDRFCEEALVNYGLICQSTDRVHVAMAIYERALEVNRAFAQLYNLAYCLAMHGKFERSETLMVEAVACAPNDDVKATALAHVGMCRYSLGRWADAIAGHYVEGLIDNKVRWSSLVPHPLMHSSIPQWKGEDLTGKTICVLHEQGYGDTFQFVRLVPQLKAKGAAKTILSMRPEVIDVLRASELADEVIHFQDVPECDFIVPMLTVPAYLGMRIETLRFAPYLRAPHREFSIKSSKPRIGLCWAGKPMYSQDRWRSLPLEMLLPLVQNLQLDFYSLQTERAGELRQSGMEAFVTDLSPQIKTWGDTAAWLEHIDALVTVDTGIAHLAGGMGVPVHLMIANASCWRWHDHDRSITPWYPSMTLHRQRTQGEWAPVVQSVINFLSMERRYAKQA